MLFDFEALDAKRKPSAADQVRIDKDGLGRGLVGAWLFNEGGGPKAFDLTNNRNHGTFNSTGIARAVGGLVGCEKIVAGAGASGDYIDCGNATALNFTTSDFSVVLKILVTSNNNDDAVISRGDYTANAGWYIALGGGAGLGYNFAMNQNFGSPVLQMARTTGIWQMPAFVRSGGSVTAYMDGLFNQTSTGYANPNTFAGPLRPLGVSLATTNTPVANLSHVLIYDRALSAAEVKRLYVEPFVFLLPYQPQLIIGGGKTASITGTATASMTEANVVAGGKTIIITLSGDTWIAA